MSNILDSISNLANTVVYNNALNTQVNMSVDFINKFGSYSNNFSEVTPIGSEKHSWYYVIAGIFIFISIFLFIVKWQEKTIEDEQEKKKPLSEKPLTILFYISTSIMVIFICYSIYRHFFVYKPQYDKWFSTLPNDARNLLSSINTIRQTMNIINNSYRSHSYHSRRYR